MECDLQVSDLAHLVPFAGSKTPHCFSTSTGTYSLVWEWRGERFGFAAAGFDFFFFSFLAALSVSLSCFEDFFFGGVVSLFALSATGVRLGREMIKHHRHVSVSSI